MDTNGPISLSLDGNSYVHVIVDAFTHYVVLHPSPENDTANALTVFFDHWIVYFAISHILKAHNGSEYINSGFTHFYLTYNI